MSDKSDLDLDLTAQCLLTFYNSAKTLMNNGLLGLINNGDDELFTKNLLSNLNNKDDQLDSSSSSKNNQSSYLNTAQFKNSTDLNHQNSSTNNTLDNNKKVHRCTFDGCSKVYGMITILWFKHHSLINKLNFNINLFIILLKVNHHI